MLTRMAQIIMKIRGNMPLSWPHETAIRPRTLDDHHLPSASFRALCTWPCDILLFLHGCWVPLATMQRLQINRAREGAWNDTIERDHPRMIFEIIPG